MVELNCDAKPCFCISRLSSGPCRHRYCSFCGFPPGGTSAPGPIAVRAKKGEAGGLPIRKTTRSSLLNLPPDTEPFDNALVAGFVTHLDIVKQFAALADQLEQTTA